MGRLSFSSALGMSRGYAPLQSSSLKIPSIKEDVGGITRILLLPAGRLLGQVIARLCLYFGF
jgi:hypothetical protein